MKRKPLPLNEVEKTGAACNQRNTKVWSSRLFVQKSGRRISPIEPAKTKDARILDLVISPYPAESSCHD